MGLVQYYRGYRIQKAIRDRRLKGRPAWQIQIPDTQEQQDAYKIAAKYQKDFVRVFKDALKSLFDDETKAKFYEAYRKSNFKDMLSALPLAEDPEQPVWQKFREKLFSVYSLVIEESGKEAMARLNRQFDTNLDFTLNDSTVQKAKTPLQQAVSQIIVPVNPYSIKWMRERSLELVKEGITKNQLKVVQSILTDSTARGLRVERVYDNIKANIGLTEREYTAVLNRRYKLEDAGWPEKDIEEMTSDYREQLLTKRAERIARTELTMAQSEGRNASWKMAQDSGQLPPVERVWISAPASPNPANPCEICTNLDGEPAPIDGTYESLIGPIDKPPAHSNCGCTEGLRRKAD